MGMTWITNGYTKISHKRKDAKIRCLKNVKLEWEYDNMITEYHADIE